MSRSTSTLKAEAVILFEMSVTNLPGTTQNFTTMKTSNFSYFLLESIQEDTNGYKDITVIER